MGRSKRKTNSPLMKDDAKTRKTTEEEKDEDAEEIDNPSQSGPVGEMVVDLKEFIRKENAINSKNLADEIRRHNEERIAALESSLAFALETNETLAKRLAEVEQRAEMAEKELQDNARRMFAMEQQLDQLQQHDLQDWLIFSGPAIHRRSDAGTDGDPARALHSTIRQYMGYSMNKEQVREMHREDRQVRVRFNATGAGSDRHFLVRNKTKLRGSGLFIRECLTPFRHGIFKELMQLKRQGWVSTVFTRDGTVFVVVEQRDRPRPVRTLEALERLVRSLAERHDQIGATGDRPPRAGSRGDAAALETSTASMSVETSPSQRRNVPSTDGQADRAQRVEVRAPETQVRGQESHNSGEGNESGAPSVRPDLRSTPAEPQSAAGVPLPAAAEPQSAAAGRRSAARERQAATGERRTAADDLRTGQHSAGRPRRPAESMSGVRRRFGGDIRRFVSVSSHHSKCD